MRRPSTNIWIDTFFARKSTEMTPSQDLRGKTVVFTGGTDGMGRVAVQRFADMGAEICLLGRNSEKTRKVAEEITTTDPAESISTVICDLSNMESVRAAAADVLRSYGMIDLLVNCAGANINARRLTADGFETNFAVNYPGPFLFTELLLNRVRATPGARIVQVSSATQAGARLDLDDLQSEKRWSVYSSYAQAKLCIIRHGRDVAKRMKGSGATIICLNPGYIRTNLARDLTTGLEGVFARLFWRLAAPAWVGGERIVAAALKPDYAAHSGAFIYEDEICAPNPQGLDDEAVARLMWMSREMAGLDAPLSIAS